MKAIKIILLSILIYGCSKSSNSSDSLGKGWSKVKINDNQLTDIFFINNSIGFTVGANGTYKSIDGGNAWVKISNIVGDCNIAATSNGNLFILPLGKDSIYRSSDNGNSFSGIKLNAGGRANDIYFINNDTGFIPAGVNNLLITTNGGISWTNVSPLSGLNISGVNYIPFFINGTTGWISSSGNVYRTNGSINNWTACTFDIPMIHNEGVITLYATSADTVYAACKAFGGGATAVYRSTNGGVNFYLVSRVVNDSGYPDIHFVDNNSGYLCSKNKIYHTINGGNTWDAEVTLGSSSLIEIHFVDANHGWACGTNGTVLIYNR